MSHGIHSPFTYTSTQELRMQTHGCVCVKLMLQECGGQLCGIPSKRPDDAKFELVYVSM